MPGNRSKAARRLPQTPRPRCSQPVRRRVHTTRRRSRPPRALEPNPARLSPNLWRFRPATQAFMRRFYHGVMQPRRLRCGSTACATNDDEETHCGTPPGIRRPMFEDGSDKLSPPIEGPSSGWANGTQAPNRSGRRPNCEANRTWRGANCTSYSMRQGQADLARPAREHYAPPRHIMPSAWILVQIRTL